MILRERGIIGVPFSCFVNNKPYFTKYCVIRLVIVAKILTLLFLNVNNNEINIKWC